MRIIQSYWAGGRKDILFNQPGWLAPEYNLISWALSCLQLKKQYKEVHLYADSITAKILIDQLKLPYNSVSCQLDQLNHYSADLWALPKIQAYSLQNEPFLHVDGDVFIWERFGDELIKSGLIAQNLESATNYYENIMLKLEESLIFFPPEILAERNVKKPILAYNAGILGGSDVDFFHEFALKAFEFVNKNISCLSKIRVSSFNIFFEQYLFYCLAKKQKKKVSVFLTDVIGDNEYKGFGDFIEVPHHKTYLHLLGNYKKSEHVCLQMANRLREDFPEYYYRIITIYKNSGHELLNDHHHFFDANLGNNMSVRQKQLKALYKDNLLPSKIRHHLPIPDIELKIPSDISFVQKNDLDLFYRSLKSILKTKFRSLSRDYLYGRDVTVNEYFAYLFSDLSTLNQKCLRTDHHQQIIQSEYDWSLIDSPTFNILKISVKNKPCMTSVIPECNRRSYSLVNLDLLDLKIISFLRKTKNIGDLISYCKIFFDAHELEKSVEEFKLLIIGRIKKGIYTKTIRVIYTPEANVSKRAL